MRQIILAGGEYITHIEVNSGDIFDGIQMIRTNKDDYSLPISSGGHDVINEGDRLAYFSGRIIVYFDDTRITQLVVHFTQC